MIIKSNKVYSSKQFFTLLIGLCIVWVSCDQEDEFETPASVRSLDFDDMYSSIKEVMKDEPERAIRLCDETIKHAELIGSAYHSGKAKWYKAYIYDDILQEVSKAYFNYNDALKDLIRTDSSSLKMKVYTNVGLLYRFYGQFEAALNSYESALKLEEDLSVKQRSDLYYNYAVALKLKGDSASFYQAEDAFIKSLELAREIGDEANMASVNIQIGLMYKTVGEFEMARIAYRNTIRNYKGDAEMADYVGQAYHGIGVTYMDEGNSNDAIQSFEKALLFKNKSGSIFITKYDLGSVLLSSGYSDEAIAIWQQALNETHDRNDIAQVKIYADLTKALDEKGRYAEALHYSNVYNSEVEKILAENVKYKELNNQILFADVIREYDEFNNAIPFYQQPRFIILLICILGPTGYFLMATYYRRKVTKKVSETVSEIQTEFQHLKID
ncbi:MAG: hypothetical protein RJQ09_13055 [Cyclobacteriaceae bacterium]